MDGGGTRLAGDDRSWIGSTYKKTNLDNAETYVFLNKFLASKIPLGMPYC